MGLKAVFFDIDGTLVDSNDLHVSAWQEAFHTQGHEIPQKAIRPQIGKGADQLVPSLLPGAAKDTVKVLSMTHAQIFRSRYLSQVKPFDHAADVVEMVHDGGKQIVLASSASREEVEHYAELLRVRRYLSGIISKDDVETSKPAGDIFAAALAKVFPTPASEALVVGDSPYDVESALRSNIKTLAVRSGGFSADTLAGAGAPYVYASVTELFEHFEASPLAE